MVAMFLTSIADGAGGVRFWDAKCQYSGCRCTISWSATGSRTQADLSELESDFTRRTFKVARQAE